MSQVESNNHIEKQSNNSSNSSSPSNSISLIKLDELSSFGATKQSRLPALIKLNDQSDQSIRHLNSMPTMSANQVEQSPLVTDKQQVSLPADIALDSAKNSSGKENSGAEEEISADGFQVVDMLASDLIGPSLPAASAETNKQQAHQDISSKTMPLSSSQLNQQHPSHLGDSLIEMIINLRNENQNLVRALETNNDYVKERLNEFKRVNEEAKRREAQFNLEKAEHEHQVRKLERQNMVLSERLKSMEAKLKDMKLEVSEALGAASSSKASSLRGENNMYPDLGEMNLADSLNQTVTMQLDANSGEIYNNPEPTAPTMQPSTSCAEENANEAMKVKAMNKEELSKRFDAEKADFYANTEDPMKQCDKLEKQLNDIGKRDYEICLLQQQLNIYRQDYRLERMANLEAKLQIEKLKNDIDRLCYERLKNKSSSDEETRAKHLHRGSHHRTSGSGVRFVDPSMAAEAIGKLGSHLSKRAAKSAAKAAKYASKQAHREEKAAAAAAAAASAQGDNFHQTRHHHHRRGVRSEVVNDLLSTANKAMLTGYKMASTHVNLALDKLSQYEQAQASQLARNQQTSNNDNTKASAPSMEPHSVD